MTDVCVNGTLLSLDHSFGKLPRHLLIDIFIRVPISDWADVASVTKQWADLFRGECLWEAALIRTFPFAGRAKRWPGPIPQGSSRRRYAALYVSKHIFSMEDELDEIIGHTYLFLKEQLELSTLPPPSGILHGTIIDQFIACGKSRDMAHDLASQIWLAVIDNLEEDEHTYLLLKCLAQEGDVSYYCSQNLVLHLNRLIEVSYIVFMFFFHTHIQDQSKYKGGCSISFLQIFVTASVIWIITIYWLVPRTSFNQYHLSG